MTIKRRLYISNSIMLIAPILLTILMFASFIFGIMGYYGINNIRDNRSHRDKNVFLVLMEQVDSIADNAKDDSYEVIVKEVAVINTSFSYQGIKLEVIKDSMGDEQYGLEVKNNTAVYRVRGGSYTFTLYSDDFMRSTKEYFITKYIYVGLLFLVVDIILIVVINRALTRFITKRITQPIEVLVSSFHEISSGNLEVRIEDEYNDEFQMVRDDFNEMANRLSDMVAERQKEEENRKELIAGISHDLRTPLTSIKAYVEGIQKGVASNEETRKRYLNIITTKVDDMEHIIKQLFLFSKLDLGDFPLQLVKADICEVTGKCIEEISEEFQKKGLIIEMANHEKLYSNIDIVLFRNVLLNIFSNSVKYKTMDTVISKVICFENGDKVVLQIFDNGPGVANETLKRLFDVFYRSDVSRKNSNNGSGVGLAIARKTMERFGGIIYAENVPTGGLCIVIELPKEEGTE